MAYRKFFTIGALALAGVLTGCAQGGEDDTGVGPGTPPGSGGGGGIPGVENCSVPLGGVCVLGGTAGGDGLVDELLAEGGALAPIADNINTEDLEAALETLLANDGNLASLVGGLLMEGQLQAGLTELLTGGEDGEGGLADILADLLIGSDQGDGLVALLGQEGVTGLVQSLLINGTIDPDCQANLGTICLIAGEDSGKDGLVDLLITEDGALTAISDNLSQDNLVQILANLLESNGNLANLVQGLLAEGQLVEGLQALLIGDPDAGEPSGLVQAVQSLLDPSLVTELLGFLGGLLGVGGGN
ncbi:hypothetical protein [Algiphilus sp.]|uniref:hypothetical protein n=1 Tax=Algiphilus sp. TaxID=1872431 RepID=UPI003C56C0FE